MNLIASINKKFNDKDYESAIKGYVLAADNMPEISKSLAYNVFASRQLYCSSRKLNNSIKVIVCSWELAHNSAGRAFTLAEIYKELTNAVEIVGCIIPSWGNKVWSPICNASIPIHSFVVEQSSFLKQVINIVASNPADIVHLSKPRGPNIFFGIFYKLLWGSKVIIDIDDDELSLVGADSPLSIVNFFSNHLELPPFTQISGKIWTRLAVGMVNEFDSITVSNHALQGVFGGIVVGHARNKNRFKNLKNRDKGNRLKHGIMEFQKVVLFMGTPKPHKGLFEIANAISNLNRSDILFVIAGEFIGSNINYKKEIESIKGVNYKFMGDIPYNEMHNTISIADCIVLFQNVDIDYSNYQIPAKLSDALALNIPVIVSKTKGLEHVINSGGVICSDEKNLSSAIQIVIDDPNRFNSIKSKKYFDEFLSTKAASKTIIDLLDNSYNNSISSSLLMLVEKFDILPFVNNLIKICAIYR